MKQTPMILAACLCAISLSACSSESPEPLEQIVVREPGQPEIVERAAADGTNLVTAGQAAFAACIACHSAGADETSGVGPNLYGVVGRGAGSAEGFNYSAALSGAEIVWSAAELDAFLTNPTAKVPGTTMAAGAVGDADKRTAIIAYLASLSE